MSVIGRASVPSVVYGTYDADGDFMVDDDLDFILEVSAEGVVNEFVLHSFGTIEQQAPKYVREKLI